MFGFGKKPQEEKQSWTARLRSGLSRSREAIGGLFSRGKIDEALYDDLEAALLGADCGVEATTRLLQTLRAREAQPSADADSRESEEVGATATTIRVLAVPPRQSAMSIVSLELR